MTTDITIENVPAEMHTRLIAAAALSGISLEDFLRQRLIALVSTPDKTP